MLGLDSEFKQDNQYFSIATPLATDKLILRALEGEEAISGLFHYRLKLISTDKDISFDSLVGEQATVTIKLDQEESKRVVDGIVTSFELTHWDDREKIAYYEAELRPWLYLLTLSGDCRIFQEKSVPDIVEAVCQEAGFTWVKKSLTKTYSPREYCVQYDESDYNFIARLLEQEGIFFYFSHSKPEMGSAKHKMVLGDDKTAFDDCPSVNKLKYRPQLADDVKDNVVTSIRYEKSVATKTYGVNSFNFETPSTSLYASSAGSAGKGSRSLYLGDYGQSTEGENYAKILQQAAAAPSTLVHGSGQLRSLASGHSFTLSQHPRDEVNAEYVVRRLRVEATRATYQARFDAFPSSVAFRPPGAARKPRIHSSQTAIVVGKAGEEIWVDKYGRVKVQFHWDRKGQNDEKSSCWIRVAQNWAGKSYGAMFLPRIGQEVIVSFLDGDPDRPIVTGGVYNAEQTVPYTLPDNSTRSTVKSQSSKEGTGKFNELRFEDKKGSEEIYVHAQKDMNVEVLDNLTTTVTGNETLSVKKGKDDNGNDKGGARSVTVEAAETHTNNDTYTQTVDKERSLTVKGKETHSNEDAFEHTVKKDYTLTIDGNLTIAVTGDVSFKGKSLTFEATQAAVSMKSATTTAVEAGTALSAKSGTTLDLKSGTAMTVASDMGLDLKSQMAMGLTSSMGLDLKAQMALNAEGLTATVKGQASGEVSASGILTLKGAMTKVG